jgi:hypothetical protein
MRPPHQMVTPTRSEADMRHTTISCSPVVVRLAEFAPVGQSALCQGWQLWVKNALSLDGIVTS